MIQRNRLTAMAAALGMLVLILDGKTALSGASDGLDLCIRSVIPSLFPFFVLSNLLIGGVTFRWLRIPGLLLKIPKGAEGLLLSGFLGGYPTGAQCIANAHAQGNLTENQANRMLAFCNNAGPSFLFGMIGPMFDKPVYPWLLWGIHILSALIVGLMLPKTQDNVSSSITFPPQSLSSSLTSAIRTMALVCGWILLFRVIIAFLTKWFLWYFPETVQIGIYGILELSNGCSMLRQIPEDGLRFLLCSGLLGFGGICVTMQTASVIGNLSLKTYLLGKWAQTGISLLLSVIALYFLPDKFSLSPLLLSGILMLTLIPLGIQYKTKIAVAFPDVLMYNAGNQNKRRDTYAVSQQN